MTDIFLNTVRTDGTRAGVLEAENDTAYFYLYALERPEGDAVLDAIHICSEPLHLTESDISIVWNGDESKVALLIAGLTWAVFDVVAGKKYGGDYRPGGQPAIPANISNEFAARA